jgi:hypothetical protein
MICQYCWLRKQENWLANSKENSFFIDLIEGVYFALIIVSISMLLPLASHKLLVHSEKS